MNERVIALIQESVLTVPRRGKRANRRRSDDTIQVEDSPEAGNTARKRDESIEFMGTFGSRRYASDLVAGRLLDHSQ